GPCPSRGTSRAAWSLSYTSRSPLRTAGKFIISPRPAHSGHVSIWVMSSTVNVEPGLSSGLAGTHDGAVQWMDNGTTCAAWRIWLLSSTVAVKPGPSGGQAGTHDGAVQWMDNGTPCAAWRLSSTPRSPATSAISCGSAITAPVPWGTTARANSVTHSIVLSMCMWASMNDGAMMVPVASTRSRASVYDPTPAILSSQIATSALTSWWEKALSAWHRVS